MSTQTAEIASNFTAHLPATPFHGGLPTAIVTECTECAALVTANVALPGEILDCADCGAELEVRSVSPLVIALAPQVEEDWGE